MESETLETFEYQGQSMFIRLEEGTLDQDWLIVRAYYADGSLVNKFVYSVRKRDRIFHLSEGEERPHQEIRALSVF